MKGKCLLILILIAFTFGASAQKTIPRFGTKKSEDNTGRVLNYKLTSYSDNPGADSVYVSPSSFQAIYKIALLDSLTIRNPAVTNSYFCDEMILIVNGSNGTRLKFNGSNWVSSGSVILSSNGVAILNFNFDGSKWVEVSRVIL